MWQGQRVVVVFPAYNEEAGIGAAIADFRSAGGGGGGRDHRGRQQQPRRHRRPDPGAPARPTSWSAARATATPCSGAWRRPTPAGADLIVLAEPDGTFAGKDVLKLLAFADDFDLVLGTRTTPELIWQEANMGRFLRWGNWVVAKLLQVLFGGPSLSDCGCTLRLLRRDAYLAIRDGL